MSYRDELPYDLATLAKSIQKHLAANGYPWRMLEIKPNYGRGLVTLAGPGEAQLSIMPDWPDSARLEISAKYPPEAHRQASPKAFKMGCSASKSPEKIAGDVQRRILDAGYLEELERVQGIVNERNRDRAEREQVITQIAKLFKAEDRTRFSDYSAEVYVYPEGFGRSVIKATGSADTLELDLGSVPRREALALLQALALMQKK